MLELKALDEVRGNNVVLYSIKTLLERKSFPKLAILSGVMGVGKTSVANIVANILNENEMPVRTYNFGLKIDLDKLNDEVFSMRPMKARAFIFEEMHAMSRNDQNALLQMFDAQAPNVYIIGTTTEKSKVLNTIRSRAYVWDFKLLSDKQLSQLLDDYLQTKDRTLSNSSKQVLLRASRGVPRDLLHMADMAISGDFSEEQLNVLLGSISDKLLYSLFCALKSKPVDFVPVMQDFIEDSSSQKIAELQDFWLRFILESSGSAQATLESGMIKTLNTLYSKEEIVMIANVLLRATSDNLYLSLVTLNMKLTGFTDSDVLGYQRHTAARSESNEIFEKQGTQSAPDSAKVTGDAIKMFKL